MSRFRDRLKGSGVRAIAEVKRRSPSAGDLRPGADAGRLAADFERAGAAAVSILVDERFGGSIDDLRAARARTTLPLLAKGFFREEAEIVAVRAAGADAALVILREVEDRAARGLVARAHALGMDVLLEAHDAEELGRAIALSDDPIGINARDLHTFRMDRSSQLELVARAPRDRVVVAESGIQSRAQAAAAELAGADAVLVGSALMRSADPGARLAELLRRPLVKVCGLTRHEDVAAAAEAGADLAGFVLADSPRRAAAPLPVPETMLSVAAFVGRAEDAGTDLVQLYGEAGRRRTRDGVLLWRDRPVARVMDLPWEGEDGHHWARAAAAARHERVLLAGGLGPLNVGRAIREVGPWCVDASRSLESAPGIKDHTSISAFVRAAR